MKRKSCPQVSFPDKLFPVISFNILAATSQSDYCLNLQLKVLQISTWALYMPLWPCTLNMCFTFQWNRSMEETICSSLSLQNIMSGSICAFLFLINLLVHFKCCQSLSFLINYLVQVCGSFLHSESIDLYVRKKIEEE